MHAEVQQNPGSNASPEACKLKRNYCRGSPKREGISEEPGSAANTNKIGVARAGQSKSIGNRQDPLSSRG